MVKVMISGNEAAVQRFVKNIKLDNIDMIIGDHSVHDLRKKIRQVANSDIIHISSIKPNGIEGFIWIILFSILKIVNKPVVLRWIGTDVLELDKYHGAILSKLVDTHLAVSPWLVNELQEKYIHAQWLFVPPDLNVPIEPLPKEFAVLIYLGAKDRNGFYGIDTFEHLAYAFPDVKFFVTGEAVHKLDYSNVEYFGFVSQEKLNELYSQTSVMIRQTIHEGLSIMVLEALSRGKYVIFSHQFPYCYYATSFRECMAYLNFVTKKTEPNYAGAKYVKILNKRDWVEEHAQLYKEIMKKRWLKT